MAVDMQAKLIATFTKTGLDILGNKDIVGTNYTNLAQEVKVNDKILLDDGLIELKVTQIENLDVICEIITGGILKNHQGINLPGVKLQIPALTDKEVEVKLDRQDRSVLKCVLEYCFILPKISYVVESKYIPLSSVSFKSISGTLKDFEGLWQITPLNLGKETQVTFSMYIDPGIPIPAFIVSQVWLWLVSIPNYLDTGGSKVLAL